MEYENDDGEGLNVNEPASPNWEHPSGRNGKHANRNGAATLLEQRKNAQQKIAEIKAKPYPHSRRDRLHWEGIVRHCNRKLGQRGTEHSRIDKNHTPPPLR